MFDKRTGGKMPLLCAEVTEQYMHIKENLQLVLADRGYLAAIVALLVVTVLILILGAVNIRPSELQVPVRYTSFGITNFYRDKWYYLLAFLLFAIAVAVFHVLIGIKLYALKGRGIAVSFVWLSVVLLSVASVSIYAVFRVVSLSQ